MRVVKTLMAAISVHVAMDTLVMAEVALTSTNVQLEILIVTSTRLDATILLVPSVVNVNQDMLVAVDCCDVNEYEETLVMSTKIVLITLDPINVCASQVTKGKTAEISMNAT